MENNIRYIDAETVSSAVAELFVRAVTVLPEHVERDLNDAASRESSKTGREVLRVITENVAVARECDVPICQDTGMAVVFAKIGCDVHVTGKSFDEAVNEGVRRAYVDGLLRLSVVSDPLYDRRNTGDNTPAVINTEYSSDEEYRDKIVITAAPKGFGSENMSALRMMTPAATEDDVVDFVVSAVRQAGANPCPPIYVGVGIGGDFELCALLSKKALLRDGPSADQRYARLEERIRDEVNGLGVGPQGFGGDVTCLGVYAEYAPTHIAGLPVAVNINCHVARHATAVI